VRDYLRHLGSEPAAGVLPPHLFPQWTFPLAARTLAAAPYPLLKVVNGGCRLEINAPLPADAPLEVRSRLEASEDDGRRVVLHQRLVTGAGSCPDALVASVRAVFPLRARGADGRLPGRAEAARAPAVVAPGARLVERWRLGRAAGLAFACLTGDFNPVHWLPPYARAFGFRGVILQGFATMARVMEALARAGRPVRLLDVRFTRPLVLPADVGLYLEGDALAVGEAQGAPAYLVGQIVA
jgi:acyl dehydratase